MQRASIVLLFICIIFNAYSQDFDLVVTNTGDSIACRIDSVTNDAVYFEMKHNDNWIHTKIDRNILAEYKFSAIQKKAVIFKPGTSYIRLYDTPVYLEKALRLQRSGKIVTITGASIIGATLLAVIVSGDRWGLGAFVVGIVGGSAGLATSAGGIALWATGKHRFERITSNMNTSSNGISFDLKPCAQYNLMTQSYQPGVVLRIRF